MPTSPSRSSLAAFRQAVPRPGNNSSSNNGNNGYVSISLSPRRQVLRPSVAEEGVRHFEDAPLPVWSVSPRRTVSPASRKGINGGGGNKNGAEQNTSSILEHDALLSPGNCPNCSFSAPLSPSANGGGGVALVQLPPTAFEDPYVWEREYVQLRGKFLRPSDGVTVYHDYASPLNSRTTMRHACAVRPLPNLEKVQEALRRRCLAQKSASAYDAFEHQCSVYTAGAATTTTDSSASVIDDTVSVAPHGSSCAGDGVALRGAHGDQRNDIFLPSAQIWCVGGSTYDNEIVVYSGATGQRLMRVVEPKTRVAVTALQHAPFRGFMETQQLHVLPVREPQDVLRLKASHLVFTDYVWCGFQDGTLRLIPASHQHIRANGPSPPYSKSPSADLVYELPRYQGGAIVSIACSPCHDEIEVEEGVDTNGDTNENAGPSTGLPNRVSEAVRRMTAASASTTEALRQHLSLVCTASTDATVIIWDVRRVYESVAQAKQQHHHQGIKNDVHLQQRGFGSSLDPASSMPRYNSSGSTPTTATVGATLTTSTLNNDVITFDCSSPIPGLQNMVVRSTCTLIPVRPVAKLSGGFAGLTALRWVSSLITAGTTRIGDVQQTSDGRGGTRVPQPNPLPCELEQTQTRFDKREAQRAELELTEEEMQGMERELEHMLPPLASEPPQSLRVNLLVAADCLGTVHVWNLDEELHRHGDGMNVSTSMTAVLGWPVEFGTSALSPVRTLSSRSEGRSGVRCMLELSTESTPTRRSTKCKAANSSGGGGLSSRDSGGSHRKTERSLKSRRAFGGLGLAEARESRSRLSELSANTSAAAAAGGASPGRKASSQQRPSLGRSSCERREVSLSLPSHWPMCSATEQQENGQRDGTGGAAPGVTSPRKSQLLRSRKDAYINPGGSTRFLSASVAAAATTTTPTKKPKKPRPSLQEGGLRSSQQQQLSTSPSLGSPQRPSASPVRQLEGHLHATHFSGSAGLRSSVQRGPSVPLDNISASPAHALALSTEVSKCQICIADGAAITDMVVDLPRQIRTTLRRIRRPSDVTASWRRRPTEEEMDARTLENEFEVLTEEKALFFAFQKLELYVGIGGAVATVRCAPEWVLPDHDGRELFKSQNNEANTSQKSTTATAALATDDSVTEWMKEVAMSEVVKLDAFQVQLHWRLLDVHVQPITALFLDSWQGHVWVARQDGFVSVLSTQDKQLISRLAHPSADALLPPPPAQEWAKLQVQSIARNAEESRNHGGAASVSPGSGILGFGLECHKECKGLPPNYLTEVLPIGARRQRALIVFTSTAESDVNDAPSAGTAASTNTYQRGPSFVEENYLHHHSVLSPFSLPPLRTTSVVARFAKANLSGASASMRCSNTNALAADMPCAAATTALVCLDGQSDMRSEFRTRAAHQWRWLLELQQCRLDAFAACQAQRHRYYALCEGIGCNVKHVIRELGDYAALLQLRTYFHAWKDHCALFRHTHLMRRQRRARLQREQPLAHQLGNTRNSQLSSAYFVRWLQFVADRRRAKQDIALDYFARAHFASFTDVVATDFCHKEDRDYRFRRQRRPLPTRAMMGRLHTLTAAPAYFTRWKTYAVEVAEQHRQQRHDAHTKGECHTYTPLLSLHRSASSPLATPSRRVFSGQRSGDGGLQNVSALDMVTPSRPIHSGGGCGGTTEAGSADVPYADTATTWTARRRMAEGEVLSPSRLRLDGPAGSPSAGLPASVEPFMAEMAELMRARVYVFHFSDARSSTTSVLDESWTVILENAESGAEGDSNEERRFSVFRFALLPLLQGLLSTAEDVLPNLFDNSVAEEVLSMLTGIVLAMDYVTTNAECLTWLATSSLAASMRSSGGDARQPLSAFDASLAVLRAYAVRAFRTDAEAADVLRGLAKGKKVLAQFLDFAMERAVARRMVRY